MKNVLTGRELVHLMLEEPGVIRGEIVHSGHNEI
jgi:hypothetical protein